IIGHKNQLALLKGFLEKGLFFSSFLFWGPEKTGKKQIALGFAKGLLCQNNVFNGCQDCLACKDNPNRDFLFVSESFLPSSIIKSNDDKPYGIDTSRAVIKFLSLGASLSKRKVVLIDNAHLLSEEAQNSLLKIIEEPPAKSVIILVSDKPSLIFETVLSRTLGIYFPLVKQEDILHWVSDHKNLTEKQALEISKFSFGRPGIGFNLMADGKQLELYREKVLELLSFERQSAGQKLILLKRFLATDPEISKDLEFWQAILRDELLFSLGLGDLSLILSKKRELNQKDLVLSLKKLSNLSEMAENFPATAESALKQMVLSENL
ncbi:MAG: polymerase III delta protein, partial [Parcubacteria group bacterium GW2011_GWC1_45_9]